MFFKACERKGIGAEKDGKRSGAGRKLSERERGGKRNKVVAQISLKSDATQTS